MKRIKGQIANILTSLRIVFSIVLMFITPLTTGFFTLYALCGVTDMIDGTVARNLGAVSKFGALLDSIADIVFTVACAVKLLPALCQALPSWWPYAVLATVIVKLTSLVIGFIKFRKPVFLHTYFNKAAGGTVFLLPFCFMFGHFTIFFSIACTVTFIAAIEELLCIIKMKEYNADVKNLSAI